MPQSKTILQDNISIITKLIDCDFDAIYPLCYFIRQNAGTVGHFKEFSINKWSHYSEDELYPIPVIFSKLEYRKYIINRTKYVSHLEVKEDITPLIMYEAMTRYNIHPYNPKQVEFKAYCALRKELAFDYLAYLKTELASLK